MYDAISKDKIKFQAGYSLPTGVINAVKTLYPNDINWIL